VLLLAVAAAAGAQVTTTLSDTRISVGEEVVYILTVEHEEPSDVAVELPELPGLRLVEGPSIRPVSLLQGNERIRVVEIRYTFAGAVAGRYVIPAFRLSVAGQLYRSSPRLLEVGERGDRSRVPFLVEWSLDDDRVYVGEAIPVYLEAYNAVDYFFANSVEFPAPANAILEEVQGLGAIEQYSVDGVELYRIPVATYMITPTVDGELVLPASQVSGATISGRGAARTVLVSPIPDSIAPTGAIGTFEYAAELTPREIRLADQATLRLSVAGEGNLHFLQIPDPELEGFAVVSDETRPEYIATERGYSGAVVREIVLEPTDRGTSRVRPATFPYLDLRSGRTAILAARSLSAEVTAADEPPPSAAVIVEPLDIERIAAMDRRVWYDRASSLGLLAPGIVFLLAFRIFRPRGAGAVLLVAASTLLIAAYSDRLPRDELERAAVRYEEGNIRAAISATEAAARRVPDAAGINYNLAALYARLGDTPRAVFAAREAIRLAPAAAEPRTLLTTIEDSAGLVRTIPPPQRFHPDLFVLTSALLFTVLCTGVALCGGSRRPGVLLAGILVVIMLAVSLIGIVITAAEHQSQLAVTVQDLTLTRIPGPESDGWLPLPGGTAVRVVARDGDSVLVETSLGLQGWVDLTRLIWNESPLFSVTRYRGFAVEYL
jgi:tetratricopeptide (TPR) repeat protein